MLLSSVVISLWAVLNPIDLAQNFFQTSPFKKGEFPLEYVYFVFQEQFLLEFLNLEHLKVLFFFLRRIFFDLKNLCLFHFSTVVVEIFLLVVGTSDGVLNQRATGLVRIDVAKASLKAKIPKFGESLINELRDISLFQ